MVFNFPLPNFLGKKDGNQDRNQAEDTTASSSSLLSSAAAAAAAAAIPVSPPPPLYCFDRDDQYQYPTLYEEADEMLHVSMLIYSITDLRSLAKNPKRKNELLSPEKVLQLPLTFHTCLESIEENFDAIQKEFGNDQHTNTMSSLQIIQQRYEQHSVVVATSGSGSGSTSGSKTSSNITGQEGGILRWVNPFLSSSHSNDNKVDIEDDGGGIEIQALAPSLTAFGDENPDTDMVYAVGVDPTRKRITVAFRGSVTPTDFMMDANIAFSVQPNPVRDSFEKGYEKICIHQGFYDYLLKPRPKEGGKNKFEEILQHVQRLFVEVPERQKEYKLYVTGHSLGGALTTLFALYAGASLVESNNMIPKPLCCFSVASPRVGDMAFQHAFNQLEERGLVRHLRIANDRDPVTLMPTVSRKKMLATLSPVTYLALKLMDNQFDEKERFRHTGIKLLLAKDACELSYLGQPLLATSCTDEADTTTGNDTDQDSVSTGSTKSMTRSQRLRQTMRKENIPDVAFHLGNAYTENLASVKSDLLNLSLNDLYANSVVRIVATKDSQVVD